MSSIRRSVTVVLLPVPVHPDIQETQWRKGCVGRDCTTISIGGELEWLVETESRTGLSQLLKYLASEGKPFRVLGFGSNVLIPDSGLRGVTLSLGMSFRSLEDLSGGRFRIGAARGLMRLARELSSAGWSGLEFAGGIPGSLGGGVKMNAGAHGASLGDCVETVELCAADGEFFELSASELQFGYRSAQLPEGAVVVSAVIKLKDGKGDDPKKRMSEYLAYRKRTQPLRLPSFGSVFQNPEGGFAGELLERNGLKGVAAGGAQFSDLHANWIVNPKKSAAYQDVRNLMNEGKSRAFDSDGVALREEVVDWGDDSNV